MSTETKPAPAGTALKGSATRRQLILAAMRLMAEKGLEGVSLRSVNIAAGAKNSSAAHYHFRNRLGLIEAIIETLERDVAKVRSPYIEELRTRARTQPLTAREIIEAAYGPFMGLLFHPEYGLPAIRFLSRLIADTGPELRVRANRFTGPLVHEVLELLTEALPEIPPRVLKMRILFSLINLINGMSDVTALETSPFCDMITPCSLEAANCFSEDITAGVAAPPGAMTARFLDQSREIIRTYSESGRDHPRES